MPAGPGISMGQPAWVTSVCVIVLVVAGPGLHRVYVRLSKAEASSPILCIQK